MQPTIVYYAQPETPLNRGEVMQIIGTALDGNPKLNQALRQFLQERLAHATVECAQATLGEREAGHAGGRVAEVVSLQNELANALNSARELRGRTQGIAGVSRPVAKRRRG